MPHIIAEAGVNHNGSLELALKLVEVAAAAGADAVKFQTFKATSVTTSRAPKAEYQTANTGAAESQQAMLARLELSREAHVELKAHCQRHGIVFASTAFDAASVDLLHRLGVPFWKIPSGEITNLPYLRQIGALGGPIVLSTGMSSLGEVEACLCILETTGTPRSQITLLHCTTEYPAPYESVNLRAMLTLRDAFPGLAGVGYSDHTQGIEVAIAAATLGATVIEKHFTLDRTLPGPDHQASLEPKDLAAMVRSIRHVEAAMGDGIKRPHATEIGNRAIARRSLVAAKPIRQGEFFMPENLTAKRPGTGLSPMLWDTVIGRRATRDYAADELIEW